MTLINEDLPALTYTDDVDLHVKLVRMGMLNRKNEIIISVCRSFSIASSLHYVSSVDRKDFIFVGRFFAISG